MWRANTRWKLLVREYFSENFVFAARFLANRTITRFERTWWAIWITLCLAACCFSVVQMYHKWNEDPIVIAFAPRLLPTATIPFPAVTICPLTKTRVDVFNLTEAFELARNRSLLGHDREMKMRVVSQVCPFARYWKGFNFSKPMEENAFENLRNMSLPFRETMILCVWRYEVVRCSDYFSEILVEDGICYTFNSLRPSDVYRVSEISPDFLSLTSAAKRSSWSQDSGYRHQKGMHAYPYRALSSGFVSGLIVVPVVRKKDDEFLCRGPYTGYKFTVHAPDEFPMTHYIFSRLNTLNAVILSSTPRMIRAEKKLRDIPAKRRKCFFGNERYLRLFKVYSQNNCAVECIVNHTLKICNCAKFSLPRTADMRICDASKINCYDNMLHKIFDKIIRNSLLYGNGTVCNCLPACSSLHYDVEMTQLPFHFHELTNSMDLPFKEQDLYDNIDPAVLFIGMKDRHYLPTCRRILIGVTDAVAKIGGLFSLLMGASVMSIGEILYYCCIRPLRREKVRNRRPVVKVTPINLTNPLGTGNLQLLRHPIVKRVFYEA